MRQQLIWRVVATTSLVLVALLLPMAALIQRFAVEDALARIALEVQATESVVTFRERADLVTFIDDLNNTADGTRQTVIFSDGDAIGPDRLITPDVVHARESGQAITSTTPRGVEVLVPVTIGTGSDPTEPEDDDVPDGETVAVIRVVLEEDELLPEVIVAWAVLLALGAGLLGLAIVVAARMARSLLTSVADLAETAEQLEAGNLTARATPGGPVEIGEVGHALNRLAHRIEELLSREREHAADLSHRLRTPLMSLRLEVEELSDPVERDRIGAAVGSLTRHVDEVIDEARRPVREGIGGVCDAAEIVGARTAFWAALAQDQNRPTTVRLPGAPLLVGLPAADLAAAVDVLLENVFAHTADGVAFAVTLSRNPDGGATLVVADEGGGVDSGLADRGSSGSGSTGLGLDIARRTAEASGGSLEIRTTSAGHTRVRLHLGPGDPTPGPR